MADLSSSFVGIPSPNPFWLASAPPTDKAYNVRRAFEAGWGGVIWKTLGEDPPIVNVSGPRYGAVFGNDRRLIGFNNIELITDRPLMTNLNEIREIKREWPDRALVVSLMVPCEEKSWKHILPMVEDTGADGIELNFGCPHGMSERGMGAAVGQVPEYVEMVTAWCRQYGRLPVIVKLTPNVTNILTPARAAKKGGADAVSLINTISSTRCRPAPASVDAARTAVIADPRSSRSRCAWSPRLRAIRSVRTCRSRASAASRRGAMRRNTWRWARPTCRCAPRLWCTASRSSKA
jgi:dihydropyrimidine dehydrogenase (NAD+) subunit PreA